MNVTQAEIAGMSAVQVKTLAVWLADEFSEDDPRPERALWRGLAAGLVRALRERETTEAYLEAELLNADIEAGAQIPEGPDSADPVAYTLRELDGWGPS